MKNYSKKTPKKWSCFRTPIFKIDSCQPNKEIIDRAAKIIKNGGVIAFPTETVYGLGTSIFNRSGILKIYQIRKRPPQKALLILIAQKKDLEKFVKHVPPLAKILIRKFWPGPLTLIFFKKKNVPDFVTVGKKTVAIRMPENKFLISLIKKVGQPIVAPSANLSGQKPSSTVQKVIRNFSGKTELILDGGKTKYQRESTIIDLTVSPFKIIREGAISRKKLERFIKLT